MTGAIVQRQPFGGCKESSFGRGFKAGGPNYLLHFMPPVELKLPVETGAFNDDLIAFNASAATFINDKVVWQASLNSYAFHYACYFSKGHDVSQVLGQDNLQLYVPRRKIMLRVGKDDARLDILRVIAAAIICKTPLEVSVEDDREFGQLNIPSFIQIRKESEEELMQRIERGELERVRLLSPVSESLYESFAQHACRVDRADVLSYGRIELLHYLREVSLSHDYHRYGNLGAGNGSVN
jgi:RHH-type proline utilization regulon transcriptional repressor/proline dehydrogenase/delta 1-pyrroline-5-carboxylate dehydrogenase